MARQPDSKVAERNQEIATQYQTNRMDIPRLASLYGLSRHTVKTILKKQGVVVKRTSRSLVDRRPLSNVHVRLGLKISGHRSFKMKQGRKDAALDLRMAETRLGELEQGFYDPNLSELIRLAGWMEVPLCELLGSVVEVERNNVGP